MLIHRPVIDPVYPLLFQATACLFGHSVIGVFGLAPVGVRINPIMLLPCVTFNVGNVAPDSNARSNVASPVGATACETDLVAAIAAIVSELAIVVPATEVNGGLSGV